KASTNDAFCPSLAGRVESQLLDGAVCGLEIVIDGVDEAAVAAAMVAGIRAAAAPDVVAISAGNYGGNQPQADVLQALRSACGIYGSSLDYLRHTVAALRAEGLRDRQLEQLLAQAERP
ncbi:MAG: hypothetical protein ACK54L_06780, partial [Betaproteobacteria bacterium]